MSLLLGCVADDLTGASDIALMLKRGGMRVVQVIGVPDGALPADADAVVVALKSRTIPAAEAVAQSLAAAKALQAAGARQLVFKYCSTFDSTDQGNIGPVAEALLALTGAAITTFCPAFPANRRTVYRGHLFVGDRLLSESPMRDHPLTPMRDPDLVRVLARQTKIHVGLVDLDTVRAGAPAIAARLAALAKEGVRFAIVDAVSDADLVTLGEACTDLPLVTGGSGIALGLPQNFRRAGLLAPHADEAKMTAPPGRAAILAGSCSAATRGQVAAATAAGIPSFRLTPHALIAGTQSPASVLDWVRQQPADAPILVYSTAEPEEVTRVQENLGRERAAGLVEETLAEVARGLVASGVTRLIVAGGETSGAVVGGLGVKAIEIGPEIDPGVPWTRTRDGAPLALALKSGNFGAPDFFLKAWSLLQ
jgi:uncharacterized protein YgbK (DUF1537 family)